MDIGDISEKTLSINCVNVSMGTITLLKLSAGLVLLRLFSSLGKELAQSRKMKEKKNK